MQGNPSLVVEFFLFQFYFCHISQYNYYSDTCGPVGGAIIWTVTAECIALRCIVTVDYIYNCIVIHLCIVCFGGALFYCWFCKKCPAI